MGGTNAAALTVRVKRVLKRLPVDQELEMLDGWPLTMGMRVADSVNDTAGQSISPAGCSLPVGRMRNVSPGGTARASTAASGAPVLKNVSAAIAENR